MREHLLLSTVSNGNVAGAKALDHYTEQQLQEIKQKINPNPH